MVFIVPGMRKRVIAASFYSIHILNIFVGQLLTVVCILCTFYVYSVSYGVWTQHAEPCICGYDRDYRPSQTGCQGSYRYAQGGRRVCENVDRGL